MDMVNWNNNLDKETEKVLLIEDNVVFANSILHSMRDEKKLSCDHVTTCREGRKLLENNFYDMLLIDYDLPENETGLDLIKELNRKGKLKDTRVIMMTAYGNSELGRAAMREGCFDFLEKPFNVKNMLFRVRGILPRNRSNGSVSQEKERKDFFGIIGESDEILKVINFILMAAGYDSTVLIEALIANKMIISPDFSEVFSYSFKFGDIESFGDLLKAFKSISKQPHLFKAKKVTDFFNNLTFSIPSGISFNTMGSVNSFSKLLQSTVSKKCCGW